MVKHLCLNNATIAATDVFTLHVVFQEDDDGHYTVLQIMQDLMLKGQEVFLEHFARLGLFGRVLTLAGPVSDDEESAAKVKDEKVTHFCP